MIFPLLFVNHSAFAVRIPFKSGVLTVGNLLAGLAKCVGTEKYVYGAGWDKETDTKAGRSAKRIGLPQNGESDCSAFVGLMVYNMLHTEDDLNDKHYGYVCKAREQAKWLSEKWHLGTYFAPGKANVVCPGDIMSISVEERPSHVCVVAGHFPDDSVLLFDQAPPCTMFRATGDGNSTALKYAKLLNSVYGDGRITEEAQKSVISKHNDYRTNAIMRLYPTYDPDGLQKMGGSEVVEYMFGDDLDKLRQSRGSL